MKKHIGRKRSQGPEIVSLNETLFSLVAGDPLAALDECLRLVVGTGTNCETFTCTGFGACGAFSCGTFKIN